MRSGAADLQVVAVLEPGPLTPDGPEFFRVVFVRNRDLSVSVPDEQVTTEVDATGYLPAKLAAMKAHETQITVDGQFYALSDEVGRRALGTEYYTLLAGPAGSGRPRPAGEPYDHDLFTR